MKPYLSLIVACYNEDEHLAASFKKLYSVLKQIKKPLEIVFIDDASTDRTIPIIKKILHDYRNGETKLKLYRHKKNLGRGKSVTDGIRKASGQIVGFLDIDLEISPHHILQTLRFFPEYDVIVANRSFDFSLLTAHRYIASKAYVLIAHLILPLSVADSEAGFKFFIRAKIMSVLRYVESPGWFWDTEIVVFSYLLHLKIKEISVHYVRRPDKTSTVNTVRDSVAYLRSMLIFYKRLKKLGFTYGSST